MYQTTIRAITKTIFIFIFLITSFFFYFLIKPIIPTNSSLHFVLTKGSSVGDLYQQLHQAGYIRHRYFFYLATQTIHKKVQAGEYQFNGGASLLQIIDTMVHGRIAKHKITLIPGWDLNQVLQALAAAPSMKHTIVFASQNKYEGQLAPDTYVYTWGTSDNVILQQAYKKLQKNLQAAWSMRAPDLPYQNAYQALIAASIIEKEAKLLADKPRIAAVIINRLKINMRLQMDTTYFYAVKHHQNSYNTYLFSGLPPTPIGLVSESSLQAALHPAVSQALYFVDHGDGSLVFSDTFLQHQVNVALYRQRMQLMKEQSGNYEK